MSGFPLEYPGVMDGLDASDPDAPSIAMVAQVELMTRQLWDNPEFQDAIVHDFDVSLPSSPRDFRLPEAVELMLQALWTKESALPAALKDGDWLRAAEIMRRHNCALDEILIASRAAVAACIKNAVKRLLASRGKSASAL